MAKYHVFDFDNKELHVAPFFVDALEFASSNAKAAMIAQGDYMLMNDNVIFKIGHNELTDAQKCKFSNDGYILSAFY